MNLFLGIDLGTSYFKAGLFDMNGNLRGLGREALHPEVDDGIKCELSIDKFWSTLRTCTAQAISMANASTNNIVSVSYSSQANSFCLLDVNLRPITPLIIWKDKRASAEEGFLRSIFNAHDWFPTTGLGMEYSRQMCIAKLLWLQKYQASQWRLTRTAMTISDYLVFELAGNRMTDCSTSSLLGILDIVNCEWSSAALDLLNIDQSYFSTPHRVGTFAGLLSTAGASKIGVQAGIPLTLGGLDHHVAAIGAARPADDVISESTGTVVAAVKTVKKFSPRPSICIAPGLVKNQYFEMTFDENGAGSLEWYQKNHASALSIPDLLELASHVEAGSEGLVAKSCASSYNNLEGFENITQRHQHGHFTRAILESTALSLKLTLEKLASTTADQQIVSTGGGAKSIVWTKIKADLLSKTFLIPQCTESACLGAAMLAATATGDFTSIENVYDAWTRPKEPVHPDAVNSKIYQHWLQKIAQYVEPI